MSKRTVNILWIITILISIVLITIRNMSYLNWIIISPFLILELLSIFYIVKSTYKKAISVNNSLFVGLVSFITSIHPIFLLIISPLEKIDIFNPYHSFGIFILLIGYLLYFRTIITLKENHTILPEAHELLYIGVFSTFRHPMYLSFVITILGLILITNSLVVLLSSIVYILLLSYRAKTEEVLLKKKLPVYYIYMKKTGWFGKKFNI